MQFTVSGNMRYQVSYLPPATPFHRARVVDDQHSVEKLEVGQWIFLPRKLPVRAWLIGGSRNGFALQFRTVGSHECWRGSLKRSGRGGKETLHCDYLCYESRVHDPVVLLYLALPIVAQKAEIVSETYIALKNMRSN